MTSLRNFVLVVALAACGGKSDDVVDAIDAPLAFDGGADGASAVDAGPCTTSFAPDSPANLEVAFSQPPDTLWTFTPTASVSGTATLAGVGPFPYTWDYADGCTTTVTFTGDAVDVYVMTWTSDNGGTCTAQSDGGTPVPCTFNVSIVGA